MSARKPRCGSESAPTRCGGAGEALAGASAPARARVGAAPVRKGGSLRTSRPERWGATAARRSRGARRTVAAHSSDKRSHSTETAPVEPVRRLRQAGRGRTSDDKPSGAHAWPATWPDGSLTTGPHRRRGLKSCARERVRRAASQNGFGAINAERSSASIIASSPREDGTVPTKSEPEERPQLELWVQYPSGTVRCTHIALRAYARGIVEQMILGPNPRREVCEEPAGNGQPKRAIHTCRFIDGSAEHRS